MTVMNRRDFVLAGASGLLAAAAGSTLTARAAESSDHAAFFLVGDTHYFANEKSTGELTEKSRAATSRLVDTLNRLPGTKLDASLGGCEVAPRGVIHCGDIIDSGDKNGSTPAAMQKTEWAAFEVDFGLNGRDGKLKLPVYELHGNHDSPGGTGFVVDEIKRRNRQRPGLAGVSRNGLHYSWNWGPVHFVNLGIVVGGLKDVSRARRFAPLESLEFLTDDLATHAKDGRPVVVTHHIDVPRYCVDCDPAGPATAAAWDPCDMRAYYDVLKQYNIAAVLYGHTHARAVFRWDGTTSTKATSGISVFNNDNSAHFNSETQAFLYFEVGKEELVVREYMTTDAWQTGAWNPMSWRMPFKTV